MFNSKKFESGFPSISKRPESTEEKKLMYYGASDACVVLMGIFRVVEGVEEIQGEIKNLLDSTVMSLRGMKEAFERKMTGSREIIDPKKLIGIAETFKKLSHDENFLAAVEVVIAKETQEKRPDRLAEPIIIESKKDMVQLLETSVDLFNQCALDNHPPDSIKH